MNFPDSPSIGDTFSSNGRTWEWDGSVWGAVTPSNIDDALGLKANVTDVPVKIATASDIATRTNTGFYETNTPTTAEGYPEDSSWYHLLANTHSNLNNYYSMQFAADFFDANDVWFRTTSGNGLAPWHKLIHSGNANENLIRQTYISTGDPTGGNDGDVWLKYE